MEACVAELAARRSDDLSDQEAEAAAAAEGDQAVASESHSPRSRDSGGGSESSSGSDTSSGSELSDLEDENEALQSSEVDVAAPRPKRHRAAASSPHDADLLEERHGTSGESNACCVVSKTYLHCLSVLQTGLTLCCKHTLRQPPNFAKRRYKVLLLF